MNKKNLFIFFVFALFLVGVAAATTTIPTWPTSYAGMRSKAIAFTGRLLCLVQAFSGPVILMFLMFGGLRYVMADDAGDALAGRRLVMDAVIGGFCVLFFLGVAAAMGVPVDCGPGG